MELCHLELDGGALATSEEDPVDKGVVSDELLHVEEVAHHLEVARRVEEGDGDVVDVEALQGVHEDSLLDFFHLEHGHLHVPVEHVYKLVVGDGGCLLHGRTPRLQDHVLVREHGPAEVGVSEHVGDKLLPLEGP